MYIKLSKTRKMPCFSWGIPVSSCITGSKLVKVPGSVCSTCYANKGRSQVFPAVNLARVARLDQWTEDREAWIVAMIAAIGTDRRFRWFDAGDVQGVGMLSDIIRVCKLTPNCLHWLPTIERGLMGLSDFIPDNLTIRVSSPMIGIVGKGDYLKSVVVERKDKGTIPGYECPATWIKGRKECDDCRACWDKRVSVVIYAKH